MLGSLKNEDRIRDIKLAAESSDEESGKPARCEVLLCMQLSWDSQCAARAEYEEVDLEDIYPNSIVLGVRGNWIELLEPRRAFIFYRNAHTGQ
jgi:hypothetical protein